jgi:hypothetical protein
VASTIPSWRECSKKFPLPEKATTLPSVRCENMQRTESATGRMTNEAHSGNKDRPSAVFRYERAIRKMAARFAVQANKAQGKKLKTATFQNLIAE